TWPDPPAPHPTQSPGTGPGPRSPRPGLAGEIAGPAGRPGAELLSTRHSGARKRTMGGGMCMEHMEHLEQLFAISRGFSYTVLGRSGKSVPTVPTVPCTPLH